MQKKVFLNIVCKWQYLYVWFDVEMCVCVRVSRGFDGETLSLLTYTYVWNRMVVSSPSLNKYTTSVTNIARSHLTIHIQLKYIRHTINRVLYHSYSYLLITSTLGDWTFQKSNIFFLIRGKTGGCWFHSQSMIWFEFNDHLWFTVRNPFSIANY